LGLFKGKFEPYGAYRERLLAEERERNGVRTLPSSKRVPRHAEA
jgi:hypothetical protein